jgi:membrane protease YdiL (CAAX protease family)
MISQTQTDSTQLSTGIISILLLALATVAELALLLPNGRWSLFLHVILAGVIMWVAVREREESAEYRHYLALLLVPLIRILSLSLPLAAWSQTTWYAAVSIPLFVTMVVLIRRFDFSRRAVGLVWGWLPTQLLIALVGIPLGLLEYFILRPVPLISGFSWQAAWQPALILLICTGFLEELLFRGLLQRTTVTLFPPLRAIFYVSLLFAVLHIGYASLIDVLFVFAVGYLFGIIVLRTNSLLGVTVAHGLTNIGLFIVWPFIL